MELGIRKNGTTLAGKWTGMKIVIINGPNLNLLGTREPEVYGATSFGDYLAQLQQDFPAVEFSYFQSNIEGELIDQLHAVGFSCDGIILNAGGYTHTAVALSDAIAAITTPVVEVHISNIYAREEIRHKSVISGQCVGLISGLGLESYRLACQYFIHGND